MRESRRIWTDLDGGGQALKRVSLGKESPGRSSQGELARERILREDYRESQGRERNHWYTPQRA